MFYTNEFDRKPIVILAFPANPKIMLKDCDVCEGEAVPILTYLLGDGDKNVQGALTDNEKSTNTGFHHKT